MGPPNAELEARWRERAPCPTHMSEGTLDVAPEGECKICDLEWEFRRLERSEAARGPEFMDRFNRRFAAFAKAHQPRGESK